MRSDCLQTALARARAVSLSGVAYRLVPERYANPKDLLSGIGAARFGGRWNPPGLRAIYLSEDPTLAIREVGYALSLGGQFTGHPKPPMRVFSVRFQLFRLLRVDEHFARAACLDLAELLRPDFATLVAKGQRPRPMQVGEAAWSSGFEGLLAPSARDPERFNLVVFPDRLLPRSKLEPVLEDAP